MAKLISLKVEGIGKLKTAFKSYKKKLQITVDDGLSKAVQEVGMTAKAKCRAQSVAQTITYGRVDENKYQVNTSGLVSVYLEFGTGNFAKTLLGSYPADWVEMARKYFISGAGRMPAQPYLYPAYQQEKQDAILNIGVKIESL